MLSNSKKLFLFIQLCSTHFFHAMGPDFPSLVMLIVMLIAKAKVRPALSKIIE